MAKRAVFKVSLRRVPQNELQRYSRAGPIHKCSAAGGAGRSLGRKRGNAADYGRTQRIRNALPGMAAGEGGPGSPRPSTKTTAVSPTAERWTACPPAVSRFALARAGMIRNARFSFSHAARSSRSNVRRTFPESSRRPTLTTSKLSGCLYRLRRHAVPSGNSPTGIVVSQDAPDAGRMAAAPANARRGPAKLIVISTSQRSRTAARVCVDPPDLANELFA